MSNTQDHENLDLEDIFGPTSAPAVTQENPQPPPTFPTVPDGVWRIITDRVGTAATSNNGRLLSEATTVKMANEVRPGMVVLTCGPLHPVP